MKIRDYTQSDGNSIIEIANRAFKEEIERGMGEFNQKWMNGWAIRKDSKIFTAQENSGVIGFLILTKGSGNIPAQIHLLAVDKKFRNRGVGKQLMKKIEEIAKKMGCKNIQFVSSAHRKGAHKFYESLGYKLDEVQGFRKGI